MNDLSNKNHDKTTLVVLTIILGLLFLFFIILLPILTNGDREYYNKTIIVSEINFVDPIDPISVVNIGVIDTDGEGYIITKHFDVTMEIGKMYDIQYYVRDNQGPRIISRIKPDFYIETYNCDIKGDVCK